MYCILMVHTCVGVSKVLYLCTLVLNMTTIVDLAWVYPHRHVVPVVSSISGVNDVIKAAVIFSHISTSVYGVVHTRVT